MSTVDVAVPSGPTRITFRERLGNIVRAREFGILAFLLLLSFLIYLARPTFLAPQQHL